MLKSWWTSPTPPDVTIVVKQTSEPEDVLYQTNARRYRIKFTRYTPAVKDMLEDIMRKRFDESSRAVRRGKRVEFSKIAVIFDDFQGGDDVQRTELNDLFRQLSRNGRHVNITTMVSMQGYKEMVKSVRSQASMFITMWPVHLEYRKMIWDEYFRVVKFQEFNDLDLPRYSAIAVVNATAKYYYLRGSAEP